MPSVSASVRGGFEVVQFLEGLTNQREPQFAFMMPHVLCDSFVSKIDEQIDRTAHLAQLLPNDATLRALDISGSWTAGDLLGHLLDCLAGFCAALYAAEPERLAHFQRLRELPVNLSIGPEEFRARLDIYRAHIAEGFALLDDNALARNIPTAFVPSGRTMATLLLGNLEHLINHKRQLFEFLKRMQVKVGTADLYVLHD
jgi:hypothetical protein